MVGSLILSLSIAAHAASVKDVAPGFTLQDMNGTEVGLNDFKGKEIVFLNFWADWCPPCHQEFPKLNELADAYAPHGVRVLAINVDKNKERVDKFLQKMKIKPVALTILLDLISKVVAAYDVEAMPSSIIIDKSGVVRFVHLGFTDKDPMEWRQELDNLLGGAAHF
jgi:peroxiredoxin